MQAHYTLGGGGLVLKRYLASIAITAGVVCEAETTAADTTGGSLNMPAASTVGLDHVGISIDGTTDFPSDPDGQLNADANVFVTVAINPDLVYRARMSGTGTTGADLVVSESSAASATGVTTSITCLKGGAIWGYDGSNMGVYRRSDATTGAVAIAYPQAIASGDKWIQTHLFPAIGLATDNVNSWCDLTDDLTEIDAQEASADMNNFNCVDLELYDAGSEGKGSSHAHLISNRHIFNAPRLT